MLYVHYCNACDKVHLLNGHKKSCPRCSGALTELPISFEKYTSLDLDERRHFLTEYKAQRS